ncbi:tetratricopeptide repeat protein [Epilithonimonas zeae]|uniref:tetratricopeptide repeat protein n=1 Tax=Epilithonimonas zeae TaxID=1416779 RepID=UPI00200C1BCB|nr:tetratricopeptide repeat protein [Epilithonimonas zeae]UQB68856.1 hypothetical protein KI430_17945 [Epilithonimonas zeae]
MYKYIIIFFLIFIQTKSQVDNKLLVNDWTKVKTKTIDGSKDLSEPFSISKYYNWKITPKQICMKTESIYVQPNGCYDYTIDKQTLRTTPDSGYRIIKLDNDSLIVVEDVKGKTEKDKVKKMWFVKTSKIIDEYKSKTKNDSVLKATAFFTPTLNNYLLLEVAKDFQKKNTYPSLLFKGNLIIYPKIKQIDLLANEEKFNLDKNFLIIKTAINKSFNNWNLDSFQTFDKIYIPFILESKMEKMKGGMTFKGVRIYFFMDDFSDIPKVYGPKMEDLELAQEYFQKAVKYLQNKNYDKAIDFFNKGYELNNSKVDALYNIVSIYSALKDKPNMCLTLKRLKDLEQVDGTYLYNNHCVKN